MDRKKTNTRSSGSALRLRKATSLKVAAEIAKAYEDGVLNGSIVACKFVRQAVERQRRDMKYAKSRGFRFSEARAWHAVEFFGYCRHSKGEWAGKPLILSPWQLWMTWVLFGWVDKNDIRRFKTAYIEVARKSGKSTWLSAVGLYLFDGEGEPGAEVYTSATKRDQARIVHQESVRMVKKSPMLRGRIRVLKDNLYCEATESKYEPLGADADSTDGLNPNGALIDELHAHKTREMWDVMETATGSRRQSLLIGITTAGVIQEGICSEVRDYTAKVLGQVGDNDSWFGVIYGIDEEDDPFDEKCWIKANPNLGVSNKLDDLQRKALRAKEMPSARTAFFVKHLNKWVDALNNAIPMEDWNACSDHVDPKAMKGRLCYGGLDVAKRGDLSAFVLLFPPIEGAEDRTWKILPYFWTPEKSLENKPAREQEWLKGWIDAGLIESTDGDTVDFAIIQQRILEAAALYDIREVAFDPWNSLETAERLKKEGVNMIEFGQTIMNFNEPTKDLIEMVVRHEFAHGGHRVLKWNASCLDVKTDPNGNIRPVKPDTRKTAARIDGMVALIMALGRAKFSEQSTFDMRVI